jgi:hypothetical protein
MARRSPNVADQQTSFALDELSESERSRIIERLKERGAPRPCELCANAEWQISEILASPVQVKREADRTAMDINGRLYPLAVLLCARCGNTKFLNLVILGLADLFPASGAPVRVRF